MPPKKTKKTCKEYALARLATELTEEQRSSLVASFNAAKTRSEQASIVQSTRIRPQNVAVLGGKKYKNSGQKINK